MPTRVRAAKGGWVVEREDFADGRWLPCLSPSSFEGVAVFDSEAEANAYADALSGPYPLPSGAF